MLGGRRPDLGASQLRYLGYREFSEYEPSPDSCTGTDVGGHLRS